LTLSTFKVATLPPAGTFIDTDYGVPLLLAVLSMWFAPKVATVIDVLSRPALRLGFGGTLRFAASVAAETIFSLMLSPIMWVCHTTSFLGLVFGRIIGWTGQMRDDHTIPWSTALRKLWPQTLLGCAVLATFALTRPAALPLVFVLMAGGLVLSVPLCVLTSWPSVGLALRRIGIGRLPEETVPPDALARRASVVAKAADPVSAD
jgi:membrane glycosyltransferase